jgi:hypothetical protein
MKPGAERPRAEARDTSYTPSSVEALTQPSRSLGLTASDRSCAGNRAQIYSSLAEEELARLKQAMNIAEESARWLRHSVRRLRGGADIDSEIHNVEEALRAAREAFKSSPEATNGSRGVSAQPR